MSKVKEPITSYSQLDESASYSILDYLNWKFKERVELIKGKVMKMSPSASTNHQRVSANLSSELIRFFDGRTCQVFYAPFDVRLFPLKNMKDNTIVQPDICVICDESKLDKRGCLGPPELIVEILSPGNANHDLKTKFDLYQEARVNEYWVVDLKKRTVNVFIMIEGRYETNEAFEFGDIVRSRQFAGLEVNTKDIFHKLLEDEV